MAIKLQLRRGTSSENDSFTGDIGEVTVDTTNKTLRVHDGSTTGGNELQSKLVSGTNIKTVNGDSLLGSGDVDLSTNLTFVDNEIRYTNIDGTLQTIDLTASNILYEPSSPGLSATNIQDAIDELNTDIENLDFSASVISYEPSSPGLNVNNVQEAIDSKADKDISINTGNGLTGGGDLNGNIVISHSDTSSASSVNNSNGSVIQDITLDGFGHITAIDSVDLDSRYYTETEADNRFVNVSSDTMTGFLTLHANPTNGLHAATKQYVDDVAQGLHALPAAKAATTGNLTATYNSSTKTLTATTNVVLPSIDGVSLSVGENILVKDQTNEWENGSYVVTSLGSVGSPASPWILTRCAFCDETDEIPGGFEFVTAGNTYGNTGWVASVPSGFTLDATDGSGDITWIQFSGAGTYTAGSGLDLNGTVFSHEDTSSQASVDNSGRTYIQDITLDEFGHITAVGSATIEEELPAQTGNSGKFLTTDGSNVSWADAGVSVSDDTTTNSDSYYPSLSTTTSSGSLTALNVSSTKLYFNPSTGQLNATNFNSLSDENKKTNIETIENSFDIINNIRGVRYNWKENGKSGIGVIAQEIEQYIPEVVSTNESGEKSVSYGNIVGILIEAIKEQQTQIECLKTELSDLKNKI